MWWGAVFWKKVSWGPNMTYDECSTRCANDGAYIPVPESCWFHLYLENLNPMIIINKTFVKP